MHNATNLVDGDIIAVHKESQTNPIVFDVDHGAVFIEIEMTGEDVFDRNGAGHGFSLGDDPGDFEAFGCWTTQTAYGDWVASGQIVEGESLVGSRNPDHGEVIRVGF